MQPQIMTEERSKQRRRTRTPRKNKERSIGHTTSEVNIGGNKGGRRRRRKDGKKNGGGMQRGELVDGRSGGIRSIHRGAVATVIRSCAIAVRIRYTVKSDPLR